MSSRLNKLEEELGVLVFPEKEEIRRASIEEFLNHVERVVATLETIDTTVWNAKTAIFILSLGMCPTKINLCRKNYICMFKMCDMFAKTGNLDL